MLCYGRDSNPRQYSYLLLYQLSYESAWAIHSSEHTEAANMKPNPSFCFQSERLHLAGEQHRLPRRRARDRPRDPPEREFFRQPPHQEEKVRPP